MKISESILPEFDQEMGNTRKVLERVPFDKFSWKPHPKSFSFGALATHVATMPEWGKLTMEVDSFDYAPPARLPIRRPRSHPTRNCWMPSTKAWPRRERPSPQPTTANSSRHGP